MRICILNRSFPPTQGITGVSAFELATHLRTNCDDLEIFAISVAADYGNSSIGSFSVKPTGIEIRQINTFYNGKNPFIRLLSNFYESLRMVQLANKLNPQVVICMTEPPLLNVLAALLLSKKSKFILWSMDLYPETFVASGLVSRTNFMYRILDRIVISRRPDFVISLGYLQLQYLKEKYRGSFPYVILPCGIYVPDAKKSELQPTWYENGKINIGYCGNLGAAHSEDFLVEIAKNLDYSRFNFIVSVYGAKAKRTSQLLKEVSPLIKFVASVPRSELNFIDIHVASLLSQWVSVCVPSKAVSSICSGGSLLYYGQVESDNWKMLGDAGWIIEQTTDNQTLSKVVKSTLNEVTIESVRRKKLTSTMVAKELNRLQQHAFSNIEGFIKMQK